MEIICMDKRLFDELTVRFCAIEKKVVPLVPPLKGCRSEKMDGQPGRPRYLRILKRPFRCTVKKD